MRVLLGCLDAAILLQLAHHAFLAYRFDHLGVLSMAIVAFASFWGVVITPMKWYAADFMAQASLHWVWFFLGLGLFAAFLGLGQCALGGGGQVFAVVTHDIGFLSVQGLDIRPRPRLAMQARRIERRFHVRQR